MTTAIVAIIVFGLLVFIHELGHFSVAKMVGIKVHEFAIGMGPKIIHFRKGETAYSIRALPLGGYVKMEGEDQNSDDLRSFNNKPVLARIAVIFAGPFMNFILSIVLFTVIFYSLGAPSTTIQSILDKSPAQISGVQKGDVIYSINKERIKSWNQLTNAIGNSQGESLEITIIRDGHEIKKVIEPTRDESTGQILIGITPTFEKSIPGAIKSSLDATYKIANDILDFLKGLITKSGSKGEVMGPVGIITLVGQVSRSGLLDVINLAAVLSINLGLMNLLPIPALDGSRILFLIMELLRGKPVDPEKEGMVHLIGFGILMSFMLFITYKDLLKLFS